MNLRFKRTKIWEMTVHIEPQAKQSAKFRTFKNKLNPEKVNVQGYTPAKQKNYQRAIVDAISVGQNIPAVPFEGPLGIDILFCFPLSQADTKTKKAASFFDRVKFLFSMAKRKNDLDNLMKPVADALSPCVIVDDGHICYANLIKVKGINPHVRIRLYKMDYIE